MAFGIDDALTTAAAGINFLNTASSAIQRLQSRKGNPDLELLIEEIRITALERINDSQKALFNLERTLTDRGVNLDQPLNAVISDTSWWKPFEQFRIRRIKNSFDMLCDATCGAVDDISALLRCSGKTQEMGASVVESARARQQLEQKLIDSKSEPFSTQLQLLRDELVRHKDDLSRT